MRELDPIKNDPPRLGLHDRYVHARMNTLGLTNRQQEVVELLMQGFSNREIADRLLIEVDTVKVHLRDIFNRLNVHRRTALVAKILELRSAP